jgi:hypothetical protein
MGRVGAWQEYQACGRVWEKRQDQQSPQTLVYQAVAHEDSKAHKFE